MPDNQAGPTIDDKINALADAVTALMQRVDGIAARRTVRRADDARDDDDRSDDSRDDAARSDWEEEKAKKDAARDTLFGKRKDAKAADDAKADDDAKSDDTKSDEDEGEDEEEDKEKKGDESKADEDEDEKEEKKDAAGEPEPMASDDDRRRDRKKDAARDDDARGDKVNSGRRASWRGDEDDRRDERRDASREDSRADSAKIRGLERQLAELQRAMRPRRPQTDDELNALAERQQEWDRVAQMHGQRASRPLDGERLASYDRRLARMFQKHSTKWKDTDLGALPIEVVTQVIAPEIRADSIKAAYRVEPGSGGRLREIKKDGGAGRTISEFVGPVDAVNGALAPFTMPLMQVRRINTQPNQY